MKTGFRPGFYLFAEIAFFLVSLSDPQRALAQTAMNSDYKTAPRNIRTLDSVITTDSLSISTDPPFEKPFIPEQSDSNDPSNRISIIKRYGIEKIPNLGSVASDLPAAIQPGLQSDPKISQCILETQKYNSDVYGVRRMDSTSTQTILEHDDLCLAPFPPKAGDFSGDTTFLAVGVLYSLSQRNFYCTATLVSDHLLITARHCAYLPNSAASGAGLATEDAAEYRLNLPSDIVFYSEAKPLAQIHISAFVDQTEASAQLPTSLPALDQENDVVFMKLEGSISGVSPASLGTSPPQPGQQMIIPGFYARLALLDELPSTSTGSHSSQINAKSKAWPSFMRYDALNTCKIVQAGKQCIFHGCQTEPGWSGAPVFVKKEDGTLVISGIQSGSLDDNSNCKAELTGSRIINFGANSDIPNVAVIVVKH
jgi:hypothetical protein